MVSTDGLSVEDLAFWGGPVVVFRWRNAPGWPVEYVSRNAEEVFGYRPEAFLSGAVLYADLILPEDLERVAQEVRAASASDVAGFTHKPYRVRHADGGVVWLHDVTRVLRAEDGRPTHYVGYVVDITARVEAERERRRLEAQLLHTQKLESLGLLAGGLAHDFNNILTGVVGHVAVARVASRAGDTERLASALDKIERVALQAGELCRQLLAYAGAGVCLVEPIDLTQHVRESLGMLEMAVSRKARLVFELAPQVSMIEADPAQLRQVLLNLVTNASEAIGDQPGRVVVRVHERECDPAYLREGYGGAELAGGRYVVLEVEDDGCGMEPEARERLFDPFFTTKSAGRGLGLAAVLGILRSHGAAVRVDSAPGRGSRFELLFPVSASAQRPVARAQVPSPARVGELCVLLAEDEPSVAEVVTEMLRAEGMEVIGAEDGLEALKRFEQHRGRIDVALLDLTMPGLGGLEVLGRLRQIEPALPVVITSGYTEGALQARLSATPGVAFLHKPYRVEDLLEAIAAVCR